MKKLLDYLYKLYKRYIRLDPLQELKNNGLVAKKIPYL